MRTLASFSNRYPRLNRESLLPIVKHVDPALLVGSKKSENYDRPPVDLSGWYPPGHGDVYRRFCESGLAEKMRKAGKEWIFISNIDNLGACVDLSNFSFCHFRVTNAVNFIVWTGIWCIFLKNFSNCHHYSVSWQHEF